MKLDTETKSSAAAYILGLSPMSKVKGTKTELQAFTEVLKSSRRLYSVLCENNSREDIADALADKSDKARKFAAVCGQAWPF